MNAFIQKIIGISRVYAVETATPGSINNPIIGDADALYAKLCMILNWAFTIAVLLGVAGTLYAAFLFMMSKGEPAKITTAKKALYYVIGGFVIALLAKGVPSIISTFLGGGNLNGC